MWILIDFSVVCHVASVFNCNVMSCMSVPLLILPTPHSNESMNTKQYLPTVYALFFFPTSLREVQFAFSVCRISNKKA